QNADERKLVLDVLKLYPSLESLKLAVKAMQIPDLKEESRAAALAIAEKVKGNADEVREILSKAGLEKAK
ncbi:MAG TPA: hypothetical protein VL132_13370, partial [Planctomycetaceae bacterium]|nr:hypothetical protein [Planctomycetaceae bacterium]